MPSPGRQRGYKRRAVAPPRRERRPQQMADILGELLARRGFARVQAGEALETAWREAAGEMGEMGEMIAEYTRVGGLRRGVLEIRVAHSVLVQELGFRKHELLAALRQAAPEQAIKDLRFRTGAVG